MARKGKPGKSPGPPQPPGKRRKKTPEPARRSASASSSGSSGAASPRGEAATAAGASAAAAPSSAASATGSGAGTPSAHGKECEQCGNCMALDGVAAARAWPSGNKAAAGSSAAAGCQICDFVAFRKSQRPCVGCSRAGCDHFCDWCGHGFHAKCARQRGEHVGAPDGFCCRKCEAEQDNPGDTSASEDDGDAETADEPGARCGACRRPFDGAAPVVKASPSSASSPASASGFRVNQSVLVDNEDMLYNAVITAVDAKGERIKIHFTRWSKSFDDWYAMDDERINESLACDCCNQWFHIGCLPPIKSSGRWKESTYVCPACIEDARAFHNGSRAVLKAKAAYISTSLAIANTSGNTDKADAKPKPRRAVDKPDADDDKPPARPAKRKRRLSEASTDSPRKRKEPAPALSKRSASASRPASPQSPVAEADASPPDAPADADASPPAAPAATPPGPTAAEVDKPAPDAQKPAADTAPAPAAATATDAPAPSPRADSPTVPEPHPTPQASPEPAKAAEAPKSPPKAPSAAAEAPSTPSKAPTPVPPPAAAGNEQTPPVAAKPAEAAAAAEETHRRRGSGHSMSSLLNSPAPDEERAPPQPQQPQTFKPTVASLPMILPHRPSPETIKRMVAAALPPPAGRDPVKLERDLFPATARGKAAAKKEPAARSRAGKKSAASGSGAAGSSARGGSSSSLSAFDILRVVATQSMSGEVAEAKPKRERAAAGDGAAAKRAKMDAATSTSSPSPGTAGGGEADRPAPRVQMNSFVDLHFNIRKEMYLRFCRLEDEGLLSRDAAHLLRALIYPTSERFQDLKFVYLVNKDLPSDQLTKRLLEVVPGGKGPAALAASLLPPPAHGHHLPPGPHRSASGGPLAAMPLFAPGVPRNVSPAGTPRMGLLPHGASLTDRLAESAIRSPLRSAVVGGPAPIPGSIKADAKAAAKRPDLLMVDRPPPARPQPLPHTQAPASSAVPNQASRAGAPLISR